MPQLLLWGARDKGPGVEAGKSCWSERCCPQLGWRLGVGGPGEGAAGRWLEGEKLYGAGPPHLRVPLSYPRLVIFLSFWPSGHCPLGTWELKPHQGSSPGLTTNQLYDLWEGHYYPQAFSFLICTVESTRVQISGIKKIIEVKYLQSVWPSVDPP